MDSFKVTGHSSDVSFSHERLLLKTVVLTCLSSNFYNKTVVPLWSKFGSGKWLTKALVSFGFNRKFLNLKIVKQPDSKLKLKNQLKPFSKTV